MIQLSPCQIDIDTIYNKLARSWATSFSNPTNYIQQQATMMLMTTMMTAMTEVKLTSLESKLSL